MEEYFQRLDLFHLKSMFVNNVERKAVNMDCAFKKSGDERIRVQRKRIGERKILSVYLTM